MNLEVFPRSGYKRHLPAANPPVGCDREARTRNTRTKMALANGEEALQRRLAALEFVHSGKELGAAVAELLDQLPSGPLKLIATCLEGVALAAAVCAVRNSDTHWDFVNLSQASLPLEPEKRVIFVEPFDAGQGWRHAALRRFPTAEFAFPKRTLEKANGLDLAAPKS